MAQPCPISLGRPTGDCHYEGLSLSRINLDGTNPLLLVFTVSNLGLCLMKNKDLQQSLQGITSASGVGMLLFYNLVAYTVISVWFLPTRQIAVSSLI